MRNLWENSGWYLIAIGIFHNVVGLILGIDVLLELVGDGLINTINSEYDRNFLFWFLTTGFFWILMGLHWQSLIRDTNKPLAAFVGWGVLLFAVVVVIISPVSGIWLFLPLAWIILHPHYALNGYTRRINNN